MAEQKLRYGSRIKGTESDAQVVKEVLRQERYTNMLRHFVFKKSSPAGDQNNMVTEEDEDAEEEFNSHDEGDQIQTLINI